MRVDILSKEYPPAIYGGAGVHVAELVRALRERGDVDVQVRCFGARATRAAPRRTPTCRSSPQSNAAMQTLGVDVSMAGDCVGADLVHSHTWYANMAGHLASLLGGMPHVVTAHSLEPMRPWKAEQLGGGYRVSSWAERTAYESAAAVVAVSAGMREDILKSYPSLDPARVHVVHNGIDSQLWSADRSPEAAEIVRRHGVDPDKRSVVFVGRITRQKGLPYLLRACAQLPPDVQIVLCAGAPDTPEILAEVEGLMNELRAQREGVVWIPDMLPAQRGHRAAEPRHRLRLPVGLRAARHRQPRGDGVRARRRRHGDRRHPRGRRRTARPGWLVPIEQVQDGTGTPVDPDRFVADLAAALTDAVSDVDRAHAFGRAGRQRAVDSFSWASIGDRTLEVYRAVLGA